MWIDVDVASGGGVGREGGGVMWRKSGGGVMDSSMRGDGGVAGGSADHGMGEYGYSGSSRVNGFSGADNDNGDGGDSVRLPLSVVDQALGQLYEAAESNTVMMVVTQSDIAPLTQVLTHLMN